MYELTIYLEDNIHEGHKCECLDTIDFVLDVYIITGTVFKGFKYELL